MIRIALIGRFLKYKYDVFLFLSVYLFSFCSQSNAQESIYLNSVGNEKNIPVYLNKIKVGYLFQGIKDLPQRNSNDQLFILETFKIFSKSVTIKSDVMITRTGTKDKPFRFFNPYFDVTLETYDDYAVISVRNTIGVSFYQIYIRKNAQNDLEIFKETAWDSITVLVEIGVNDVESKRADLICLREDVKIINDIIYVPESLNLNEKNTQDCHIEINSDM